MEWQKAVEETRRGRYTAVVGALKNDAPGFVFPPNAQGAAQSVFFVKKGASWKYAGVDSLKKVKVGVIEGYSYNDEVDAYIAAHKGKPGVLVATGDAPLQVLIEHLMKGDIDTFIEDPSVFANYCGTKKLFNVLDIIKDAGACGPKEKIYIAFSPANPKSKDYAAALSAGLGEMRKSGELKKLLAKYYLKDWE
jgi:polar amino acid transport system substrate-binding protein